ncbi:MAG: histidinol-phosphatase [Rubripirellula sp.]|nr:histidinol-phosphatase [Rubripirellula sp.]
MTEGPQSWKDLHSGRLQAIVEVVQAAGHHTLTHFRGTNLTVDAKADDSPVTIADREAEQLVRNQITERFPDDTLQGEEFAEQSGTSDYRWIVDPIDGTKSFICGVPLYSTLLALEHEGKALAGAIFIPALGELLVAAIGRGCWYRNAGRFPGDHPNDWNQARVSEKSEIDQAIFVTSQVDSFATRGAGDAYQQLEKAAWITRSWGDGYGYLLVATGRAEIMVDPVCNPWDVAAISPVLTEAGGQFTDWKGNPTTRGGDGLGTNGRLHSQALKFLEGH